MTNKTKNVPPTETFKQKVTNFLNHTLATFLNQISIEADKTVAENNALKQRIEDLKNEKSQLEAQCKNLEDKNIELEEARTNLLGIAGVAYARSPSMALVGSDRPQNHSLADEYRKIKNDHLDTLSTDLNNYFIELNPELNKEEKYHLSLIRSIFSREILLRGYTLIKEGRVNFNNPTAIDHELLNKVYEYLCTELKLSVQTLDIDSLKNEINNFLLIIKDLATGKVQYPNSQDWQEEDFINATKEILHEIYYAFESTFKIKEDNLQNINNRLENVIEESLKFLQQVSLADPPGIIVIEKEGEAFDSVRHVVPKGCNVDQAKSYQVKHTIYPFYIDQGRVLEEAVVWVEENDEDGKVNQLKQNLIDQSKSKAFSPTEPTVVNEVVVNGDLAVRQKIEEKIDTITEEDVLEKLLSSLENSKSLSDFQNEINQELELAAKR